MLMPWKLLDMTLLPVGKMMRLFGNGWLLLIYKSNALSTLLAAGDTKCSQYAVGCGKYLHVHV